MRAVFRLVILCICVSGYGFASGHGPVFGLATPTNSEGETSIDVGANSRVGSEGSDVSLRTMVTYGFTPHLQISIAAPGNFSTANLPPSASMGGDLSGTIGWRFHHRGPAVGKRFETTLFSGVVLPELQRSPGLM